MIGKQVVEEAFIFELRSGSWMLRLRAKSWTRHKASRFEFQWER